MPCYDCDMPEIRGQAVVGGNSLRQKLSPLFSYVRGQGKTWTSEWAQPGRAKPSPWTWDSWAQSTAAGGGSASKILKIPTGLPLDIPAILLQSQAYSWRTRRWLNPHFYCSTQQCCQATLSLRTLLLTPLVYIEGASRQKILTCPTQTAPTLWYC